MALVAKGNPGDNPQIPEDYYFGKLTGINSYPRDNGDALGAVLEFTINSEDNDNYDGATVQIPFFAPAKLSVSSERESSRLGENLRKVGLLEPVLDILDCKEEILDESHKWIATDEDEFDDLKAALNAVFEGKLVRVNVEDSQDGDSSQVQKLSKAFPQDDEEEASEAESADGLPIEDDGGGQ